jgi:hypothetical protein
MHALSVATMPETQSQPSHLKEETSTSAAALIRDTGKQQSGPCFYRSPFLLSFLLILEHPGKENIQLDLQAAQEPAMLACLKETRESQRNKLLPVIGGFKLKIF